VEAVRKAAACALPAMPAPITATPSDLLMGFSFEDLTEPYCSEVPADAGMSYALERSIEL
jgi:hypothetical protein